MAVSIEALEAMSWRESVEKFIAESPWLTEKHLPQLKALYAIAKQLDGGGRAQAALISQFTLTQRTLMGKAPEPAGSDMPDPLPGMDRESWGPAVVDADSSY